MMRKRFVVIANGPDASQKQAVIEALRSARLGWWHWYQDAWLISDRRGRTVVDIRELLRAAVPNLQFMVIQADGKWSGWTSKKHYDWMYNTWDKP